MLAEKNGGKIENCGRGEKGGMENENDAERGEDVAETIIS